jgi:hypothetical protein
MQSEASMLDRRAGYRNLEERFRNDLELNRIPGGQTTMMTETMWRCDQVRAGRLYNRMMFDTREEAEQFMNRMRQMEPDQTISIEAIDARQVWN